MRPHPRPLIGAAATRPGHDGGAARGASVLILVRHGESTGNAEGLLLGRIDSPLTDRGLEQARSLAAAVSGATRLVSSPLTRARDTAEALGTGLPVEVDERWVEMDYGEYDGRKLGDVPPEVWRTWRSDPTYRAAGRGEPRLRRRPGAGGVHRAVRRPGRAGPGGRRVVVVSHVSPIKAAACWSLGLGDEGAWRLYLANASVTRITWGAGGAPVLAGFNDTPWSTGR